MFVSIKQYLNGTNLTETLFGMIKLLVEGIRQHAAHGEESDHARFQMNLLKLEEMLQKSREPDVLLETGTEVVRVMEEHSHQTARFVRARSSELHSMVSMLTDTVVTLTGSTQRSVGCLLKLENTLECTAALDDIREVRSRLSECLDAVRVEAAVQREEADRQITSLRASLERARGALNNPVTMSCDVLTGLPDQQFASEVLGTMIGQRTAGFAVVFVIHRIKHYNDQFGHTVGDDVLLTYGQHLAREISQEDRLFRWRGPSFLVLIERQTALDVIRAEMQRIGGVRLEKTVALGKRVVTVPVSATWAVYPLSEYGTYTALDRKIGQLLAHEE